jgi:hypothetical protein
MALDRPITTGMPRERRTSAQTAKSAHVGGDGAGDLRQKVRLNRRRPLPATC